MYRGRKKLWACNTKIDIYIFLFVDVGFFFVLDIHLLVLIYHNSRKIGLVIFIPYLRIIHTNVNSLAMPDLRLILDHSLITV